MTTIISHMVSELIVIDQEQDLGAIVDSPVKVLLQIYGRATFGIQFWSPHLKKDIVKS